MYSGLHTITPIVLATKRFAVQVNIHLVVGSDHSGLLEPLNLAQTNTFYQAKGLESASVYNA